MVVVFEVKCVTYGQTPFFEFPVFVREASASDLSARWNKRDLAVRGNNHDVWHRHNEAQSPWCRVPRSSRFQPNRRGKVKDRRVDLAEQRANDGIKIQLTLYFLPVRARHR